MPEYRLFTSESVTEGHPDKIADQVSDAVLDEVMRQDPDGRVAVETLLTRGLCVVAGELTTSGYIEIPEVVRQTILDIGYDDHGAGFDGRNCGVMVAIQEQSRDIACGVDEGGAGDQGIMIGYATDETPQLMPAPIMLAHQLAMRLAEVRRGDPDIGLRPDGKTQVTVRYDSEGKPVGVETVVVAAQHHWRLRHSDVQGLVEERVLHPVLTGRWKYERLLVNPTGSFVTGGPAADTGVTGRKIMVDTYGGMARHGGGCFSGKDATKVDRSGAYLARYAAKNIVAAGLAGRCEVELAYAIGARDPVAFRVHTFGTGKVAEQVLEERVREVFPVRPRDIIEQLGLRAPIYRRTACYGHFGREHFSWEKTDRVDALKDLLR